MREGCPPPPLLLLPLVLLCFCYWCATTTGLALHPGGTACKFLLLLRHGESDWNEADRYIGWADRPLTPLGEEEARMAGRVLRDSGFSKNFHVERIYTSHLRRAIKTWWLAADEMDVVHVPEIRTALLNERYVGDLIGRTAPEASAAYGKDKLAVWRSSYSIAPPPVKESDPRHPVNDRRYHGYEREFGISLPSTESMVEVEERARIFWETELKQELSALRNGHGKETQESLCGIACVAHANILKGLMTVIDGIDSEEKKEADIVSLGIPRASPILYCFDSETKLVKCTPELSNCSSCLSPFSATFLPASPTSADRKSFDGVNSY